MVISKAYSRIVSVNYSEWMDKICLTGKYDSKDINKPVWYITNIVIIMHMLSGVPYRIAFSTSIRLKSTNLTQTFCSSRTPYEK